MKTVARLSKASFRPRDKVDGREQMKAMMFIALNSPIGAYKRGRWLVEKSLYFDLWHHWWMVGQETKKYLSDFRLIQFSG